ncbi:hypothetical protein TNCV_4314301 [Trichonephila clavipes]|nr:hypothetical protein TNCV_4314301 [Trichonephila clavipes]
MDSDDCSSLSLGDCRANSTRFRMSRSCRMGIHTANPVKTLLIQTFGKTESLRHGDFWLWGYLKSRVYIRSIKSAGTERCDPQRSILHTSTWHSPLLERLNGTY